MIVVKLMGGLGNQMFQYALGRQLAKDRCVLLKLDLSWFQKQTLRSYQLDAWKIPAEIASPGDIDKLTRANWGGLKGRVYRAIQRRLPYYWRRVVVEQVPLFDSRILNNVSRNAYLMGYWQSEKYFKTIEPLIRQEFRLKQLLSPSGAAWAEKINACHAISIHVRRGDYVNNLHTHQFHGACNLDYYRKAAECMRQNVPEAVFFVFSDDLPWACQNLGFLQRVKFVDVESDSRDEEELILMSMCQHHIIANSSFSWWGAWLGTYPGKIVIAPKNWFIKTDYDTSDLLPTSWWKV